MINNPDHPIVFFDGVCNFCNRSVQFILRNDPERKFRYASLQSSLGQRVLQEAGLPANQLSTLLLLKNGKLYRKSTAALLIAAELRGLWPALYALTILPAFLRDPFYDLVARNRYRLFGKQEACMIPDAKAKDLFIS
ncbi:MAG: DCC1-like thiol-disulfide oxidoreductase family protein [Sediminibacterium sp.]|nr:DCC1-like thiol-disulfide oxidoreductase family protein [Sediminibacterium sp.]